MLGRQFAVLVAQLAQDFPLLLTGDGHGQFPRRIGADVIALGQLANLLLHSIDLGLDPADSRLDAVELCGEARDVGEAGLNTLVGGPLLANHVLRHEGYPVRGFGQSVQLDDLVHEAG